MYRAPMVVLALWCSCIAAEPQQRYQAARDQALVILTREDSYRAIEYVSGLGSPRDVMGVFMLVSRDLYWTHKNLPAAMAMGRAGIQYGITEADRPGTASELAYELRSDAKTLAYDLSSFCWPGWNEPDIDIDESNLVLGQDLAKTNLRLAETLHKGNLPMSRALWLIGAHHLAVEQNESARRAFVEGTKFAIAAEAREQELLLRGYVYLSDMLKDPGNEELTREFEFILNELERTRDGTFYRDQLETARLVFLERPAN